MLRESRSLLYWHAFCTLRQIDHTAVGPGKMDKVLDSFLNVVDPTKQYQELYATYSTALDKLRHQFGLNIMQIQAKQADQCLQILKKYLGDAFDSEYSVQVELGSGTLPTDRLYVCRRGCQWGCCQCFNIEVMLGIQLFRKGEAVADYAVTYRQNPVPVTKRTIRFAEPFIVNEQFASLAEADLQALGIETATLEEALAHMYRDLVNAH